MVEHDIEVRNGFGGPPTIIRGIYLPKTDVTGEMERCRHFAHGIDAVTFDVFVPAPRKSPLPVRVCAAVQKLLHRQAEAAVGKRGGAVGTARARTVSRSMDVLPVYPKVIWSLHLAADIPLPTLVNLTGFVRPVRAAAVLNPPAWSAPALAVP